jgi:ribosomal protein S18 acetylase RimI-like enzyme
MKLDVAIRTATHADAEMLTELGARTFYEAFAPTNTPESMEAYMSGAFTEEQLSSELADPLATFLIAEIGRTPVGYVKLLTGDAPDCVKDHVDKAPPIEIVRFYVDRKFHGGGAAHVLMQACFDHAKQSGLRTIFLGVWEHNPRAIAFYRKWGFEIVGSHVFHMGAEAQNDYWMARRLSIESGSDSQP